MSGREERSARMHQRLEREAQRQRTEYIKSLESELQALKALAWAAVEDQMDHVNVHPCDEHSEDVKARGMPPVYQELYKAVKMQADNKPLSIHFNADSVTIECITYSNDMFRQFGGLMPLNQTFRLVQRSTGISSGSVTVEYVNDPEKPDGD